MDPGVAAPEVPVTGLNNWRSGPRAGNPRTSTRQPASAANAGPAAYTWGARAHRRNLAQRGQHKGAVTAPPACRRMFHPNNMARVAGPGHICFCTFFSPQRHREGKSPSLRTHTLLENLQLPRNFPR